MRVKAEVKLCNGWVTANEPECLIEATDRCYMPVT
jgi:hypothetical protein